MNKRKFLLAGVDIILMAVVCLLAVVAFPNIGSVSFDDKYIAYKIISFIVIMLISRIFSGVYSSVWRYATTKSYFKLIFADFISAVLYMMVETVVIEMNLGFAYVAICTMAVLILTLISRFTYQALYAYINRTQELSASPAGNYKINIAIIGAGNVGASLALELMRNPGAHYHPYCFIDNDKSKIGNTLHGIRIYGENEETIDLIKELPIQEIIIALPDADSETKKSLYERYKSTNCKIKIYDYSLDNKDEMSGKRTLREINIEDLLFRDTIELDKTEQEAFYSGKRVLVTGGGGSIGSELCRQIAKSSPEHLIIVDIYENNAYDIQQELIRRHGNDLKLSVIIASVRDKNRIDKIFSEYKPQIVFHAAAHKHVPLMESSPAEAIKNNVFGTYNVAEIAEKHEVEKFILISTDKAVNPTNIMGGSKRLCEMIVQSRTESKTDFVAVRFGNVLGSNGSVIPLFKKQIEMGGPITLTDKRIIRYFMTIPEAVGLVMKAGTMAHGGEIFVLDMGKPIKILDMAEKMIQLSGLVPNVDIKIVEIGLRPGEKLYEELLIKTEELDTTSHNRIFVERDLPLSREEVEEKLKVLTEALETDNNDAIFDAIRATVPTYRAPIEINRTAEHSEEMRAALS